MRIPICLLTLAMGFIPSAHSQVFKCTGPDGRMVYIDRPCSGKTSGEMLLRERTLEEKLQEREEAYIAEMRKQERRAIEQEREMAEEQRRYRNELRAMRERQYQPEPQHKGYEERLRERNASVQSTLRPPPRKLRPTPSSGEQEFAPPVHREKDDHAKRNPQMLSCNGGFCHDTRGGVYHQHGPNATTMTGPNGRTCIKTGASVQCH